MTLEIEMWKNVPCFEINISTVLVGKPIPKLNHATDKSGERQLKLTYTDISGECAMCQVCIDA